jgi:hypothetical protein
LPERGLPLDASARRGAPEITEKRAMGRANGTADADIDEVYQALRRGVGRELVTDANVQALIRRAQAEGHPILAEELREWQAPCGGAATPMPPTGAPRPTFNQAHKKH